jgi:hypothetical protein
MTTKRDYRADFRKQIRDESDPYLFSDDEVDALIQEAREQASISSKCVDLDVRSTDTSNPARIAILDSVFEYPLDPSVFRIRSLGIFDPLSGVTRQLQSSTPEQFDSWAINANARPGSPQFYYVDDEGILVLDGSYADADSREIVMTGKKRASPLVEDDDIDTEIKNSSHRKYLIYYALALAYEKADIETEALAKSKYYFDRFEKMIGVIEKAESIRRKFQYRNRSIKNGWF